MLMTWGEQTHLVDRFQAVRSFLKSVCRHWQLGSSYEGWRKALHREHQRLVPFIVNRLRQLMKDNPTFSACGRWQAFAVDGSQFICPRTLSNQQAMGDVGKPDGMPQLSLTCILHLGLNLPWAFRVGPGTDSERAHLRDMLDELPADSLLVADAGFVGYELCRDLLARRQHFLLRVGGNIHLLSELGYHHEVRGQTVYLWPLDQQKQNHSPLGLRLIVLRDEQKQPIYLVTSVLDPNTLTDAEAGEIFKMRWGIEVHFRTVKQTMQHHVLRSRTPENCYLEMTWAMLGVWLLELMAIGKLVAAKHGPKEVSPARVRTAVRRVMRNERPCPHNTRSLAKVLAECRKDNYTRHGSKASRDYPRKKRTKPPSPPKIKLPSSRELIQAKQLTPITIAA
jgi:hypothetical protein